MVDALPNNVMLFENSFITMEKNDYIFVFEKEN